MPGFSCGLSENLSLVGTFCASFCHPVCKVVSGRVLVGVLGPQGLGLGFQGPGRFQGFSRV